MHGARRPGEELVGGLVEGEPEGAAVGPHGEVARIALEHVDGSKAPFRIVVVAGWDVDPQGTVGWVTQRVVSKRRRGNDVVVDPAGQVLLPGKRHSPEPRGAGAADAGHGTPEAALASRSPVLDVCDSGSLEVAGPTQPWPGIVIHAAQGRPGRTTRTAARGPLGTWMRQPALSAIDRPGGFRAGRSSSAF